MSTYGLDFDAANADGNGILEPPLTASDDAWICGTPEVNRSEQPEEPDFCLPGTQHAKSVYGIDFGTTNASIALVDVNGNAAIIPNYSDACDTLAAVVYFESEADVLVGDAAKDVANVEDKVVECIRYELGKDGPERRYYGKTYSAVDISAIILKRLAMMADEQGHTVRNVVVACPVYYGAPEKAALTDAIRNAGLHPLQMIPEPVAAVLGYTNGRCEQACNVMVCDLGGRTFEATMLRMSMEEDENGERVQRVKVLATGGSDRLGGADWDQALFDHILYHAAEENGLQPEDLDAEDRQCIRSRVEQVKKRLSSSEKARVRALMIQGQSTTLTVERAELEEMTAHLVWQMLSYIDDVVQEAGAEPDMVLLAGGAIQMPMVRNAIEARFPGRVQMQEPQTVVARGAAVCGSRIPQTDVPDPPPVPPKPPVPPMPPVPQADRSYGVKIRVDGQDFIWNLIKKGDMLPAKVVQHYVTVCEGQERIVISLFENDVAADEVPMHVNTWDRWETTGVAVRHLGDLELKLAPGTERGISVVLAFHVDEDGFRVEVERAPVALRTAIRFAN